MGHYIRSVVMRKYTRIMRCMGAIRVLFFIMLAFVIFSSPLVERETVMDPFDGQGKHVVGKKQKLGDLVLESSRNDSEDDAEEGRSGSSAIIPLKNLALDASMGLLDKSRMYKTHPFVITGDRWAGMTGKWRVCLSTQTSPDLLFNIAGQSFTWTGPMSVSVFVPAEDYTIAVMMIQYLRKCFPAVRKRATFHMTYPNTLLPELISTKDITNSKFFNCSVPEEVNRLLVKEVRSERLVEVLSQARYPQNLLRNMARKGCHSEYVFTPDVDMISVPTFSDELNEFLGRESSRNCSRCAFVIPIYEISLFAPANPKDKTELTLFLEMELAQRFHIQVFEGNQANSQLDIWEKKPKEPNLDVLYNITTWRKLWEPIYVTKGTVPPFDERFVGYGCTRNTQVYEMHVAGYQWLMLNNGFLTHRGFQTNTSYSEVRKAQVVENCKQYKFFKKEIYARYNVDPRLFETKLKEKPKIEDTNGKEVKLEKEIAPAENKAMDDVKKEDEDTKMKEIKSDKEVEDPGKKAEEDVEKKDEDTKMKEIKSDKEVEDAGKKAEGEEKRKNDTGNILEEKKVEELMKESRVEKREAMQVVRGKPVALPAA